MADGKDEKDLKSKEKAMKNKENGEKAESEAKQVAEPDSTVKNDEPGSKKAPVAVVKAEADSSPTKAPVAVVKAEADSSPTKAPTKAPGKQLSQSMAEQNPQLASLMFKKGSEKVKSENLPAEASSSKPLPAQAGSPKLRRLLSGGSAAEVRESLPAPSSAEQQSDSEARSVSPTKRAAKRGDGSDEHPTEPKQLKSPARKPKD